MISRTKNFIKNNWNDPVWSKVFANTIWAVLTLLAAFIVVLIKLVLAENDSKNIQERVNTAFKATIQFFKDDSLINNFILVFFLSLVAISFFRWSNSLFKRLYNRRQANNKKVSEEESLEIDSISMKPYQFFLERLNLAFPAERGLKWYRNTNEIIHRLEILLERPLKFKIKERNVFMEPIWWFKGPLSLRISSFKRLTKAKALMDGDELKISKIAVYKSRIGYNSFVYVEVDADKHTGLYDWTVQHFDELLKNMGYVQEEFAIYKGKFITLEEYSDGSIINNGRVEKIDYSIAEYRSRYLTRYNFIIASHDSVYNVLGQQEDEQNGLLNEVLFDEKAILKLIEFGNGKEDKGIYDDVL